MMRVVYILKGDRYYVGSTNNLERRLKEHKKGDTYTTKRMNKRKLSGYFACKDEKESRNLEKEIKQSGHAERYTRLKNFLVVE